MAHYWEIIANEIHAMGWSYGFTVVSDPVHGLLHCAFADKDDGHRFTAQAETRLTAFMELKAMVVRHENGMDKGT